MNDMTQKELAWVGSVEEDIQYMSTVLKAAKWYVEKKGWAVFPLHSIKNGICTCGKADCSDAGKHPRIQKGLHGASKDMGSVEEWFGPAAQLSNIGIRTGNVSGVTVVDIDIGHGKLGAETWAELIAEKGEPETLTATTGSGGMHVFFAYNSTLKTSSNTLGKGVDVRNDNGYVVAAPSRHRSGGMYSFIDYKSDLASLPAHLAKKKETRGRPKKDDYTRSKYTIEQVRTMLEFIPTDDRDDWRHFGIILGREFDRSEEAWEAYNEWSEKDGAAKGRGHDEIMREAFYDLSQENAESQRTLGTIVHKAIENGWVPKVGETPIEQFVYFAPANDYIYRNTVEHWVAASVDRAVSPVNVEGKIMKASEWLARNALATSMTSDPNYEEDMVKGFDCRQGEMVPMTGAACFNAYRRPDLSLLGEGEARRATRFVEHVQRVFPGPSPKPGQSTDADQLLDYLAHRVQKPGEKPRFAILMAGEQGTGKDTCIEFVKPAIGYHNIEDIEPAQLETNFNEYEAATLVRISETANLHEMNKWAFNEKTKTLIAGNPDSSTINPKYGKKYSVRKFCGVILTTNHLATGIYIPPGDRRYDVLQSATLKEMGIEDDDVRKEYFNELYGWWNGEGRAHVAAFLMERDLSKFDPNIGQRKTAAHQSVVMAGKSSDEWLDDALNELGYPHALRTDQLMDICENNGSKRSELKSKIGSALTRAGYSAMRNPAMGDGRWSFGKKKSAVYVNDLGKQINWSILEQDKF